MRRFLYAVTEPLPLLALLALTLIVGVVAGSVLMQDEPKPAELPAAKTEVVRVLDIVIRDSNTTGRRQRFVCYPNPKKETP